jgi:hypothetical protein
MRARLVAGVRGEGDLAVVFLAAAAALSGVILIDLLSGLTFITDDWELLLNRRGSSIGDFLDPFHEHVVLAPVLIYRLLLAVFGMDSALPFQVVAISVFILSSVLLFVHLRPRVGAWAALLGAILILFLGAAFEDLLFPFQVGYFGSISAGLGMLIALDRDDRRGDRIACVLLAVSMAFSSLGLCFLAGALVDLTLSRRPRRGRLYVALLPLELWVIWWLGWGHTAESAFSLAKLDGVPEYVFDAAGAGITSLLGLATGDGSEPDQPNLVYGQILLVAGIGLAILRLPGTSGFPRGLAIMLAIALSFWVLTALNKTPERLPTSSRYQFPSAVFLLLIAAELLRGVRIGRTALVAAVAVTVAAAWGGMSLLRDEYDDRWLPSSDSLLASLAGIELARGNVDPAFRVNFISVEVTPRTYFSAIDEHGSPAYDEEDLAARPEIDRATADGAMAAALGLRLEPAAPGAASGCRLLGGPSGAGSLALDPGSFRLLNRGRVDAEVLIGRFSDGFPVGLGGLPPGGSGAALEIPSDRSNRPWRLGLGGGGGVRVCATAGGASLAAASAP